MGLCCSRHCRNSSSDKCKSPCSPVNISPARNCAKATCGLAIRDRVRHVEVSRIGTVVQPPPSVAVVSSEAPDSRAMSKLSTIVKGKVSKKRIRYQQNGYDLDLTYITSNIIAMGYPASNIEAVYRNNIEDVARFLDGAHKDHYKIYNLCSERAYDTSKFHNRVEVFPFDDHNPPKLELIEPFCNSVQNWLHEDSANVAVVHCKAGKGRTGTMICCYLLHSGKFSNSEDALNHYGGKRTQDMKGVTIPSQLRYVNYYARLVRDSMKYRPVQVYIKEMILEPSPCFSGGNMGTLCFSISQPVTAEGQNGQPYQKLKKVLKSEEHDVKKSVPKFSVQLDSCSPLVGDVKVEFYYKVLRKEKLFQFWFNTFFVCEKVHVYDSNGCVNRNGSSTTTDELLQQQTFKFTLSKKELDIVNKKDKQNKTFSSDFHITLLLSRVPTRHAPFNHNQSIPTATLPPTASQHPLHHKRAPPGGHTHNYPQSIYPHTMHHIQQQHGNGSAILQQQQHSFLLKQQQLLMRQQHRDHTVSSNRALAGITAQTGMIPHRGVAGGGGLMTSASAGMINSGFPTGTPISSGYHTKAPQGCQPLTTPHPSSSGVPAQQQLQSATTSAAIIQQLQPCVDICSDSSTSSSDDDSSDGCCGGGGGDKGDDDDTNDEYNWDSGESQSALSCATARNDDCNMPYDNMNAADEELHLLPHSTESIRSDGNVVDVPLCVAFNDSIRRFGQAGRHFVALDENAQVNCNADVVIVDEDQGNNIQSTASANNDFL